MKVHRAAGAELDPQVLYRIMRLRSDVFVVEQACAYPDLDGRDMERDTSLLWVANDDGEVVATARLLHDEGTRWRIGRVCTRQDARRSGHGTAVMNAGVDAALESGAQEIVLDAQSQRQQWYERFGFAATGREFVEDGILHVEMIRR